MSIHKTSTSTLSTTSTTTTTISSSSSSPIAYSPPRRYSTPEPIKPKPTAHTSAYPRARPRQQAGPHPRAYATPARSCPQTQAAKPKKSLPKKILSGTGQVLGFCAWVLCFSCVLSGGQGFGEKQPHQRP
ncbi:hypothetical protein C7212DRAFT_317571 [Tuber magnatum]|uniref:Uncharacterized protein n=1 Tax=Tuber magnatum TaxID=42249 RepID=A0A317SSC0_9PEZI|nr:hypothetical protein C7212DRAFT_317571 [Tuber magnatum]